jgi:hypothetical protein
MSIEFVYKKILEVVLILRVKSIIMIKEFEFRV